MEKAEALVRAMNDPNRPGTDREIARRALGRLQSDAPTPHASLSAASSAMLAALKKTHLSEVTESEIEAYVRNFGLAQKRELIGEWAQWVAPLELLQVIRMPLALYWANVRDEAQTGDIRRHAELQIAKLSEGR